jgi:hypothetical protein
MAFTPGYGLEKTNKTPTGFVAGYGLDKNKSTVSGFTPGFGLKSKASSDVSFTTPTKAGVDSTAGLYQLATDAGLKDSADRLLEAQRGEKPKEIFSGGFITDIFDTLNALQYGVTGLLKGKSFLEGVKTRQSFTDDDALGENGIPGLIGGIALDILVDPLTYISPLSVVRKIPGLTKVGGAIKKGLVGTKVLREVGETAASKAQQLTRLYETAEGGFAPTKALAQKFAWMFGADPVFRKTYERGLRSTAISSQKLVEMTQGIAKLSPDISKSILKTDDVGRLVRAPLNELKSRLTPTQFDEVAAIYSKIDSLGKEAVDLGILNKATYEENLGKYIKNAYLEYETAKKGGTFGVSKLGIKGTKKRKAVEDVAEFGLTQVDNPAYLLFKSAFDLNRDVENAKLFSTIGKNFGRDVAADGFTKLPDGKRFGSIAGKYIPDHMAQYINEIIPADTSLASQINKKIVGNFKFFKVVMNPATHARNMVSNQILNYWKLGMNPLDPRAIQANLTSVSELAKKSGKWLDEVKPLGFNVDTFASAEMRGLLESTDVNAWGKTIKGWDKMKRSLGEMYQAEENQAKLAAYIFNRTTKKLSPEDAWKGAEAATFNYAQVTPFIRKLRESLFGFPFITFTVKSTPAVLETAAKTPGRISVIGKIKQGIENMAGIEETERERSSAPSYVKDGFYVKLPIKDKLGRSAYFDMTYILPFGDIVSGNFFERGQKLKTGAPESLVQAAANKSPFIQTIGSLYRNEDFYGNKIFRETDSAEKQLGDVMLYLTKTYAPPLVGDQLPGGYKMDGERQRKGILGGTTASSENTQRTLMQELLRNVGAKVQPISADIQEKYVDWSRQKALLNLLKENGIVNEMNINYVPKK